METLETPSEASAPSQTLETTQEQNPSTTPSVVTDQAPIPAASGSDAQDDGTRLSDREPASIDENKAKEVLTESLTIAVGLTVGSEVPIGGVGDVQVGVSNEGATVDEKENGTSGDVDADSSPVGRDSTVQDQALEVRVCAGESVSSSDAVEDSSGIGEDRAEAKEAAVTGVLFESGGGSGIGSGEGMVLGNGANENCETGKELFGPLQDDGPSQSNGGCSRMEVDSMGGTQENGSGVAVEVKEPSSSVAPEVVGADVCLPGNGQGEGAKVGGTPVLVSDTEKIEQAEVVEAAVLMEEGKQKAVSDAADSGIAVLDSKQNIIMDVADAGITALDEMKQLALPESVAGERGELAAERIELPEEVKAPTSLVEEKQNVSGHAADAGNSVIDEKLQPSQEPLASEGEEVAAEGSLPGDVELTISLEESKQNISGNVADAGLTGLDMKEETAGIASDADIIVLDKMLVPEPVAGEGEEVVPEGIQMPEDAVLGNKNSTVGIEVVESFSVQAIEMDVCLPDNGQKPGPEVAGACVEAGVSCLEENENSVGLAAHAGISLSDTKQQTIPEPVASKEVPVAAEGSKFTADGVPCHEMLGAGTEVTQAISAQVVTNVAVVETHVSMLESPKYEEAEVAEAPMSLPTEEQNPVADAGIALSDEKQQTVPESAATEGEKALPDGNQFPEDGVHCHENPSAGIEVKNSLSTQAIAMDICLPENGQNPSAKVVETNVEVPGSCLVEENNSVGDAAFMEMHAMDVCSPKKGEVCGHDEVVETHVQVPGPCLGERHNPVGNATVAETLAIDVRLPENGQNPGAEVMETHAEALGSCPYEKSPVGDTAAVEVQSMGVCLPENGQSPGAEIMEMHAEVPASNLDDKQNPVDDAAAVDRHDSAVEMRKIEGAEVIDALGSPPEQKLVVMGDDATDAGITLSDEKQQAVPESIADEAEEVAADENQLLEDGVQSHGNLSAGTESGQSISAQVNVKDPCLQGHVQNRGAEVVEMHVQAPCSDLLNDRQNIVSSIADAGTALPEEEQQTVPESVSGEGEQVAAGGNEFREDSIQDQKILIAGVEVTGSGSAQEIKTDVCVLENQPVTGDEVAGGQYPDPETEKTEEAEVVEAHASLIDEEHAGGEEADISLPDERQNVAGDADAALPDDKQQAVQGSIAGEGAAIEDQFLEDGIDDKNPGAFVVLPEADVSMSGAEEKEDEDEAEDEDGEDEEDTNDTEDQFSIGDFVWGKIRSHPWWPGQIYDPSDASDFARKYRRRDRLLVAYFGDGTFAWCYPSQLRPFNRYFDRMMKQGSTKGFLNAVDAALLELSRCVESEMTCSCVPEDMQVRLIQPLTVNAGIKEGTTVPRGHVDGLSVTEFDPANFISRLKDIASVVSMRDALELTVFKSRLSAFYSAKGYGELPMYQLPKGITDPEDDAVYQFADKTDLDGQSRDITQNAEVYLRPSPVDVGMGKNGESLSQKRPQISGDKIYQRKKRSVAELMAGNVDSELENDGSDKDEEGMAPGKLVVPSKEQRKMKKTVSPRGAKEEDFDAENDVNEEGKGIIKSASSSRKRRKGKDLGSSPPRMAESKSSDVENDDVETEEDKIGVSSASSSKRKKKSKHLERSSAVTENNKDVNTENDDVGAEEEEKVDKSALSSRNRKKTRRLASSPPASPENKVTFDVEIDDDGPEEGAVLSSPRSRKRSKYLSAPYTKLSERKSTVSAEDTEAGNAKTPVVSRVGASISRIAVQLTGSRPVRKCTAETPQKKVSKETDAGQETPGSSDPQASKRHRNAHAFDEDDGALDEMLPDIHSAAEYPVHPKGGSGGRKRKSVAKHNSDKDSHGADRSDVKGRRKKEGKEEKSLKAAKRKSRRPTLEDIDPHPATLLLTFESGFTLPSKDDLITIFNKFGALNESETEVLKESGCAQVAFSRSSDAEAAFMSVENDCPFGPANVNYRLRYLSAVHKVSEIDGQSPKGGDKTLALPSHVHPVSETQHLLSMQRKLESMISLLSKLGEKGSGPVRKLTPTIRADLSYDAGILLKKVTSLLEDP